MNGESEQYPGRVIRVPEPHRPFYKNIPGIFIGEAAPISVTGEAAAKFQQLRLMREAHLWREIAAKFLKVERVGFFGPLAGLCTEVEEVNADPELIATMRDRKWKARPFFTGGAMYWWPRTREGDDQRVRACLKLARICERKAKKLTKKLP